MSKGKFNSKIISVRALCELAKVDYFVLYRRKTGVYKTDMKTNVRTRLVNALIKDIEPFINDLGFEVAIKPQAVNPLPETTAPQR